MKKKVKFNDSVIIISVIAILTIAVLIAGFIYLWLCEMFGVKCGHALAHIIFLLCLIIWWLINKSKQDAQDNLCGILEYEVGSGEIVRNFINSLDGWFIDEYNTSKGMRIISYYNSRYYYLTYKGKYPTKEQSIWLHKALTTPAEQTLSGYRLINKDKDKYYGI